MSDARRTIGRPDFAAHPNISPRDLWDRIERLVLFGSRARGDAHVASDYDIAVFLKDLTDR